jgi:hypothetical protein
MIAPSGAHHMSHLALINELTTEVDQDEAALEADRHAAELLFQSREKQIEDKRVAIRVLEEREQRIQPQRIATAMEQIKRERDEGLNQSEPEPTFTAKVTNAVESVSIFGDITIKTVFDWLADQHTPMPNNPRIKIGTILRRLEERGRLKKIGEPEGNESTKYDLVTAEKEPAA